MTTQTRFLTPAKADPRRKPLLGKVHLAKKQLGLDDATYRAILARHGYQSSADMPVAALVAVIEEFKAKGWQDKPAQAPQRAASPRPLADGEMARKIRALWLACYHLGAVQDPSESAIEGFLKRQTGIDKLAWLPGDTAYKVVEALKAMARRKGVTWSRRKGEEAADVVKAQMAALGLSIGAAADLGYQHSLPVALFSYEPHHWIALMELLGERIRAATP